MKRYILTIAVCLYTLLTFSQSVTPWFRRLSFSDGLSDNKVNVIMKSREGYIWIGTTLGLNRYDGFRVQSFYSKPGQTNSLPDNVVVDLAEGADGMIWVETSPGYSIFNPVNDEVYRNTEQWMKAHGMGGRPLRVASDQKLNLWMVSSNRNFYHYDFSTNKAVAIPLDKDINVSNLLCITPHGDDAYLTLDNGTIVDFSLSKREAASADSSISKITGNQKSAYRTFIDSQGGLWTWSQLGNFHYDPNLHSWKQLTGFIVRDIAEDHENNILIATDHSGLLVADLEGNIRRRIVNNPDDGRSLPDNTLQSIYVDDLGVTWIGLYRMGLVHYYHGQTQFSLLPLGDICTMAQAPDGSLWLGTNDSGIRHYNPETHHTDVISKQRSGLGTDVVVSSLAAKDGNIWFGTFQGGLARIKNGAYTVYNEKQGTLVNNSIWTIAELANGTLALGTLGSGVQLFDPASGKFSVINNKNSKLPSDWISSISVMKGGWMAIGHSQGVSLLRLSDHKIINIGEGVRKDGSKLTSPSINQVCADSRGLLWIATSSGLNVYDKDSDKLYTVSLNDRRVHSEVNSVCEDHNGIIWITLSNEVKSISAKKRSGSWQFYSNTYGRIDGVQARLFNKRSIACMKDGYMLMGGIDGVNVINPKAVRQQPTLGNVIFSGLTLYDRPVAVGDSINGHVMLHYELNNKRYLTLDHDENTFTIQLATSAPGLPNSPRFLYRLQGQDDRWLMTSEQNPSVQFTNLPPGHYKLEVRPIDNDGNALDDSAFLNITIRPPFYLSVWAIIVYIALAIALVWYIVWRSKKNRRNEMEKLELKKEKEIEESKMNFFTNIGHEFRTPIALILSPLESIIKQEHDPSKLQKLKLMQRNAHRLLMLINQMLDLRRLMGGKEVLKLSQDDIVAVVRDICNQFTELSNKGLTLTFHTDRDSIVMSFDRDKVGKIVTNLLSNAYKFTPHGGRVDVSLRLHGDKWLDLEVADTGQGVSDEDKKHLFDRFYQSSANKQGGGSGIGLNIVWEYAKMHGGKVSVSDNDGGGTIFIVSLPVIDSSIRGNGYVEAKADDNVSQAQIPLRRDIERQQTAERKQHTAAESVSPMPSQAKEAAVAPAKQDGNDRHSYKPEPEAVPKCQIDDDDLVSFLSKGEGSVSTSASRSIAGLQPIADLRPLSQIEPNASAQPTRVKEDYRQASPSPKKAEAKHAGEEPVEAPKATVLIVDDNDDFLMFLSGELEPYFNIRTASNGQEALDSIHKSMPNLVLTDVMMPVMDGNELCRRIKGDDKTKQIPVVMLTARLADENEIESRECGADDYVKKPFNMQILLMCINNQLAKGRITPDGKVQPRITQPKITSEDEKFVDKATRYVEKHLDDVELSVEQMAEDLGMSRVQLYRRLVTVVGKTPTEFIRLIRLRHAERLLMESQLTVSQIAYRVGFSSQRYFSKCFKELYGYMPTEYKRERGQR